MAKDQWDPKLVFDPHRINYHVHFSHPGGNLYHFPRRTCANLAYHKTERELSFSKEHQSLKTKLELHLDAARLSHRVSVQWRTHRTFSSIWAYCCWKWQSLCVSNLLRTWMSSRSFSLVRFKNNENNICRTVKTAKHWSFPETARWFSLISHTCSWTSVSFIFIAVI